MTKEEYLIFSQHLIDKFFEHLPSRVSEKYSALKDAKPQDYVLSDSVLSEVYHDGDTVTLMLAYHRVAE